MANEFVIRKGFISQAHSSVSGTLTAINLVKSGGTSSEFLKADGSVDSTTYLPSSATTFSGVISADDFFSVALNRNLSEVGFDTKINTGVPYSERSKFKITVTSGATITVSLSFVGTNTSFSYYINGKKFTVTAATIGAYSATTASAEGVWFFYINNSTTNVASPVIVLSQTPWTITDPDVLLWDFSVNATDNSIIWIGEERHTAGRDIFNHARNHAQGAIYKTGFNFKQYNGLPPTSLASNTDNNFGRASLQLTNGSFYDEDILNTIVHSDASISSTNSNPSTNWALTVNQFLGFTDIATAGTGSTTIVFPTSHTLVSGQAVTVMQGNTTTVRGTTTITTGGTGTSFTVASLTGLASGDAIVIGARIPIYYISAIKGSKYVWRKLASTDFLGVGSGAAVTASTISTFTAQYNSPNGGWATVTSNRYYPVYLCATNVTSEPIIAIMGQGFSSNATLTTALSENPWSFSNLVGLADLSVQEIVPFTRLTYMYNTGGAFTNTRIKIVDATFINTRVSTVSGNVSSGSNGVSDHAALTNLTWANSGHIGTTNTFAGFDASGLATNYTESNYLLASGARTGATSQAQAFTNGVITGKIYPSADSTSALLITKADGTTAIVTVDSTNKNVNINGGVILSNSVANQYYTIKNSTTDVYNLFLDIIPTTSSSNYQQTVTIKGQNARLTVENTNDPLTCSFVPTYSKFQFQANGYYVFYVNPSGVVASISPTTSASNTPRNYLDDGSGNMKVSSKLYTSKITPSADSVTAVQITKANGTTNILNIDSTNNRIGLGTVAPNAQAEFLGTTEQLRLSYDATHYASFTVNSAGSLTLGGTTGFITANKFITNGGSSTQFVKGDGSLDTTTYAANNQTMYVGTTSLAINRSSSSLSLTGITSIDGASGSLSGWSNPPTASSGGTWNHLVGVASDGGAEIGSYIDFHNSSYDTTDYAVRLATSGGTSGLYINNTQIVVDSGTWNISISGTAATANSLANSITFASSGGAASNTTFNGSAAKTIDYSTIGAAAATHSHAYLPLSGGALTGDVTSSASISLIGDNTVITMADSTLGFGKKYGYSPQIVTGSGTDIKFSKLSTTTLTSSNISSGTLTTLATLATNGTFTATADVVSYSDARLKTNVKPIANPIEKVMAIGGYTFNRLDVDQNQTFAGVLAQEIEQVLPEVVKTNDDGIKSVAYGNIVALLIEAIKAQQVEINELKTLIK